MASRRDELNAYTFAKRRLISQFLQPTSTGTEEGAPQPLRAVWPGAVMAIVILAAFGAWGMFKPTAPKDWDTAEEKVIVADKSTTRYVVLKPERKGGKPVLHPVLNLASAKLLLTPDKGEVVKVKESVIDGSDLPHGATIGIPYAPDRLPEADDAGEAKRWAVCERPAQGNRSVQKAAFVLAERDRAEVDGKGRLRAKDVLYVQGPDDKDYVVDHRGTKYPVDGSHELLIRSVVNAGAKPQRVSAQWLNTLHTGDEIGFPEVPGLGRPARIDDLDLSLNTIGTILEARAGGHNERYIVLRDRVAPISDFASNLILSADDEVQPSGEPEKVTPGAFTPTGSDFDAGFDWPKAITEGANSAEVAAGSRNTVCNVLRNVDESDPRRTTLSTWVGERYPISLPAGSTSAYVTPGTGLLYRQVTGTSAKAGATFLVTDTGLRYALQSNGDSTGADPGAGTSEKEQEQAMRETRDAQTRLGYGDVKPAIVPLAWSEFLPTGPRLSTSDARQPQGS
ncbi:type VII secretion protein EccB [Streptomyces boninensis]|uniref:type VII secretion protein EccB n=1 Tax=Streptomyces boninensis TaxID=2039455 RepID=UPI003B210093